jgi:hypothetical protein
MCGDLLVAALRIIRIGISTGMLLLSGNGTLQAQSVLEKSAVLELNPSNEAKPAVTVADSIQMIRVAGPANVRDYYSGAVSSDFAVFSPDGKWFVVVVKKGNIERNANEYSMLLFPSERAFEAPAPVTLVTFAPTSGGVGIQNVAWLDDSDTVLFLGERPGQTTQVYSVRCSSKKVEQLTDQKTNVVAYSVSAGGKKLVFGTEYPVKSLFDESALRDGFHVSGESLYGLILGRMQVCCEELFMLDVVGSKAKPLHVRDKLLEDPLKLFLSPNGRYLAVRTYVPKASFPRVWSKYNDQSLKELLDQEESPERATSFVERYELIDTRDDVSQSLLDSPVSPLGQSEVSWSSDSKSVILTGVYLPLDIQDTAALAARESGMFTVEVGVPGREIYEIANHDLKLIDRRQPNDIVMFSANRTQHSSLTPGEVQYYRKQGPRWESVTPELVFNRLPEITVEQDLNTPPQLVAIDTRSGRKELLWDPNPQFKDLKFGRVEDVKWLGAGGHEVRGGLYLPPDYSPGKRYPLVIQTHGYDPQAFWIDGPFTSAFASQSLAGKGIVVLQIPDSHDSEATPEEAPLMVNTFERAIDYLDGRGLIDPNRVGIVGFSRTCLYVAYMLTHSRYKIAAATLADGVDGGYFEYIASGASIADESDRLWGIAPFGKGLATWLERSPGFQLSKVEAAVRLEDHGDGSDGGGILSQWEWFIGLSRLHKAVDLIYLPKGTHILDRPSDRMASQQGNVDWFCFWLKAEEDPDPAKAQQYSRWRELRKLQDADQKTPAN